MATGRATRVGTAAPTETRTRPMRAAGPSSGRAPKRKPPVRPPVAWSRKSSQGSSGTGSTIISSLLAGPPRRGVGRLADVPRGLLRRGGEDRTGDGPRPVGRHQGQSLHRRVRVETEGPIDPKDGPLVLVELR